MMAIPNLLTFTLASAAPVAEQVLDLPAAEVESGAEVLSEVFSTLPVYAIALPLLAMLLIWLAGRETRSRNWIALAGAAGTLGYAIAAFLQVGAGHILTWRLAAPFGTPFGLELRVDGLGATFGLVVAFVWFAATIYSWTYMEHGTDQSRFYIFLSVVLAGMMGIAYAGSFLTLLPFFELMSLTAYVLVAHTESKEAMAAGNTYLYMSAFGGLSLLAGIAAMQHFTGTTAIAPAAEAFAALPAATRWAVIGLISTGFAVKAGAVPLHVWLPKAHPVAPSPASALLSGVMIKAGAYGIIRAIVMVLTPHLPAETEAAWELSRSAGTTLIWIGVVTMLTGVGLALLQENAKRMLAYHSISQMGYILVGVGAAAYLGAEGAIGLSGATLHLVNHALFKACLFLAVGAVLLKTDEANMYHLGGMWRYMPFTAAACLVAAAGISGVPGLNGYVSKTLLHHAITEVAHVSGGGLVWAERLFVLTGIGTAASFVKLFSLIFLGRTPEKLQHKVREEWPLKVGMALLVIAIVAIGLAPNLAMDRLLGPAALGFGYDTHLVEHIVGLGLFGGTDLLSLAFALVLGTALCFIGLRTGLFHLHGPVWLSYEYVAVRVATVVGHAWLGLVDRWTQVVEGVTAWLVARIRGAVNRLPAVDYLPGPTETAREFNLLNLDFNLYLVLGFIAVVVALVGMWQGLAF